MVYFRDERECAIPQSRRRAVPTDGAAGSGRCNGVPDQPASAKKRWPVSGAAGNHQQGVLRNLLLPRSEEHTSELQSLMRISYAVFCLKKKKTHHLIYDVKSQHDHTR